MKNLLLLIKKGWNLKVHIWRCRRFDKISDEYIVATHYQKTLDNLENTEKEVNSLISETQKLLNQFQNRKELTNLLSSVITFLNHINSTRS